MLLVVVPPPASENSESLCWAIALYQAHAGNLKVCALPTRLQPDHVSCLMEFDDGLRILLWRFAVTLLMVNAKHNSIGLIC